MGVASRCAGVDPTLWVTDCVATSHADTLTADRHQHITVSISRAMVACSGPSSHDFLSELSLQIYTCTLRKQGTGRELAGNDFLWRIRQCRCGNHKSLSSFTACLPHMTSYSGKTLADSMELTLLSPLDNTLTATLCFLLLSPFVFVSLSGQILHTGVVYLHNANQPKEAEKLRHLMTRYRYWCFIYKLLWWLLS